MLASKFVESELTAYIADQRLNMDMNNLVKLIAKAFEAYDQYRKLVTGNESINYATDTSFRMDPSLAVAELECVTFPPIGSQDWVTEEEFKKLNGNG